MRSGRNPAAQIVKRLFEEIQHEEEYTTLQRHIYHRRPDNAYRSSTVKWFVWRIDKKTHTNAGFTIHQGLYLCTPVILGTIGGCTVRRTNYEMKIVEGKVLTKRCIRMDSGSDIVFIQLLHDY